jgi:hypothetical protein
MMMISFTNGMYCNVLNLKLTDVDYFALRKRSITRAMNKKTVTF